MTTQLSQGTNGSAVSSGGVLQHSFHHWFGETYFCSLWECKGTVNIKQCTTCSKIIWCNGCNHQVSMHRVFSIIVPSESPSHWRELCRNLCCSLAGSFLNHVHLWIATGAETLLARVVVVFSFLSLCTTGSVGALGGGQGIWHNQYCLTSDNKFLGRANQDERVTSNELHRRETLMNLLYSLWRRTQSNL